MITIDTTRFNQAMAQLRQNVGIDAGDAILQEETAQCIKTVINLDNKLAMLARKGGEKNSQGVRSRAVEVAIRRTMRTLDPASFTNPEVRRYVKHLAEGGTTEEANEFFARIKKGRLVGAKAIEFSAQQHIRHLNPRTGRTAVQRAFVTRFYEQMKLAAYIRSKQERVGFKFSGFLAAANAVKQKLPTWVSKHGTRAGSVVISKGLSQFIEFENRGSKDVKLSYRFQDALATRRGAIATKVRRLIRGEAVNLGFAVVDKSGGTTVLKYRQTSDFKSAFYVADS